MLILDVSSVIREADIQEYTKTPRRTTTVMLDLLRICVDPCHMTYPTGTVLFPKGTITNDAALVHSGV